VSGAERKRRKTEVIAYAQSLPLAQNVAGTVRLGVSRKKDSYFKAQFNRLRGRHGTKKAICVVAASMLPAAYHMLKDGTQHQDLGASHFDHRSTEIKARRLASQIAKLGYQVELRPLPEVA
jgi:transposase